MMRMELTRSPVVRRLLASRWPQFVVQLVTLAGLLLVIASGLVGTPVGNRNFAIVMVWIAWWAVLILVAVPIFGRAWCSVCPLPLPGEWLQRGALLGPGGRGLGLGLRWPRRLRGLWVQNGAFLLVAIFSLPVLTQPRLTGVLLAGLVLLAVAASLIFERRAFCRYLCPVGGFIGLYAQAAPVEIRVRDTALCAAHTTKTCYLGNSEGYGCPWGVFPGSLKANTYCGTCLECLRTCPYDNVAVNLRPAGADLTLPGRRGLDETFKTLLLLGSGLAYTAVLLGPSGQARAAAAAVGSAPWMVYALAFLAFVGLLVPLGFLLATRLGLWISRQAASSIDMLRTLSPGLVPLGLALWISFSLTFLFANLSYVPPALSDPLNLGWNFLAGAGLGWRPLAQGLFPWLSIAVLLAGLVATSRRLVATAANLKGGVLVAVPACALVFTFGAVGLWLVAA
jgi:polyferredoxin